jgi:chromosome segregation ATPase
MADPKAARESHDALAAHVKEIKTMHEAIKRDFDAAGKKLDDATRIADGNKTERAKIDADIANLSERESTLKARQEAHHYKQAEFERNVSAREAELNRQRESVVKREHAVAAEEARIEAIKREAVARLAK